MIGPELGSGVLVVLAAVVFVAVFAFSVLLSIKAGEWLGQSIVYLRLHGKEAAERRNATIALVFALLITLNVLSSFFTSGWFMAVLYLLLEGFFFWRYYKISADPEDPIKEDDQIISKVWIVVISVLLALTVVGAVLSVVS